MHTWTPLFLFSLQVRWSLEPLSCELMTSWLNANINMCKIFADIVIMWGYLFSTIDNYKQTNWNFRLFFFNKGLINICYVLYWEPSSSEIQNIKLQVKFFFNADLYFWVFLARLTWILNKITQLYSTLGFNYILFSMCISWAARL